MPNDSAPTPAQRYAAMQKRHYDEGGQPVEVMVGWYAFHENVPYETLLLFENGDVRKPLFEDFASRRALDVGCGEGRMIRRMSRFFGQVDGVDVSARMASAARERCPGSQVWLTDGMSCGEAPTDAYDFAYCTISLQHVAVHETRTAILRDVRRALRPGGKVTLQMLYSRNYPFVFMERSVDERGAMWERYHEDRHHARWFDSRWDAQGTNSECDVMVGRDDLAAVLEDFAALGFADVSCWFHDISIGRSDPRTGTPEILPKTHPNSHCDDAYLGTHFLFLHGTVEKPSAGSIADHLA